MDKIEWGYLPYRGSVDLYPLQWLATEKLEKHNCVYIFDETGAGKTISSGNCILRTIISKKEREKVNVLIVSPGNLTLNWYNKMLQLYGIEFKIWRNTAGSNRFVDENNSNLIISSYDSSDASKDNGKATALDYLADKNVKWDLIVLDEAHNINAVQTSKNIRKLKSEKIVVATATPIKNTIEELQKLIHVTQEIIGNEDLGFYQYFKANKESILYDCSTEHPFMRNFKEIVGNTDSKVRQIQKIEYEVTPEDRIAFIKKYPIHNFEYFQNCSNLELVLDNYQDNKYQQFLVSVKEQCAKDYKSIIFCRRVDTVRYLHKKLTEEGIKCKAITSESFYNIDSRKRFIQNTNKKNTEESEYQVIITIDTLLNEGFDMTSFNVIYNYELPFTPAQLEQRYGRIDRLKGSKFDTLYMYSFGNYERDAGGNKYYPDEFDNAYQNILDVKLSEQVLSNIPAKSLLTSEEIRRSVLLTFQMYQLLKRFDAYLEHQDIKLNDVYHKLFTARESNSIDFKEELLLRRYFDSKYSFVQYYNNVDIKIKEHIESKETIMRQICDIEAEEITADLINDRLINATDGISSNIIWVDKGITVLPLSELKQRIQGRIGTIEEKVKMLKAAIQKSEAEVQKNKAVNKIIHGVWQEIKACNYVYGGIVFLNLWKSFYRGQMNYSEFVEIVNEVISNE